MSTSNRVIRYGSLFSGIEAATLAFESLGWQPEWFAELDPFCCKVLTKHWPHVPNRGDVTNPQFAASATPVDLIIGGSPCPSFSLAGKRKGIEDPRGLLTLRYCEIVNQMRPRWFIWENVPGVLSSNNGKDFGVILNEMVKSGYSVCWRVLDARWFGLPQSRQRLFVVGRLGNDYPPEVLFEPQQGTNAVRQHEAGQQDNAAKHKGMDFIPICMRGRDCGVVMEFMDCFGCLRATTGDGTNHVWDTKGVRKLTPLECERLQGMPDNHTKLNNDTPDWPRWKAIGNSMAVPVVLWIGKHILDACEAEEEATVGVPPSHKDVRSLNNPTIRKENDMNVIPMKAPMFPNDEPNENSSLNVIPMKAPMFPIDEPNENSTLDELAAYALQKQKQVLARDKMNAEDLWLIGQALEWAKNQKPHGGFEKWFKSQGLKKTYVWLARTLHKEATLDKVKELGLTEALRKFGVLVEKKPKPEAQAVPSKEEDEKGKAPLASNENATEPTDEDSESDEESSDDSVPDGADALAEEEEKELKEFQDALRQHTPKTRAVAIQHALELLRDELNEEEVDQELQDTFRQIAELAEALKGLNKPTSDSEAA